MQSMIKQTEAKTIVLQLRVTPAYIAALDAWCARQEYEISRSEAIRRITLPVLNKVPKSKPKQK
jgi:hypothetical protein